VGNLHLRFDEGRAGRAMRRLLSYSTPRKRQKSNRKGIPASVASLPPPCSFFNEKMLTRCIELPTRDYINGYDHLSKLGVGFYPVGDHLKT
jgi:hypothetical protein